jgi:hypothetical protein
MNNRLVDTKFFGFAEPANGSATLFFSSQVLVLGGSSRNTLRLRLRSHPWHQTGLQPFVWDYLPPLGNRNYPVIRIVASRDVTIESEYNDFDYFSDKNPFRFPEIEPLHEIGGKALLESIGFTFGVANISSDVTTIPKGYGRYAVRLSNNRGLLDSAIPNIGPSMPMIQIVRPQHYGVLPNPDSRIKTYDLITPPYFLRPNLTTSNRAKQHNRWVRVAQHPTGLVVQQVDGKYKIDIRVRDPLKPAAFWVAIVDPEATERNDFQLLAIHNSNVKITVTATKGNYDKVSVYAAKVSLSQVPFQGESLGTSEDQPALYQKLSKGYIRPKTLGVRESFKEALFVLFDTVLSTIPIVGEIYDVAQFGYAAATGTDFWGRKVSEGELAVLGAAILLPVSLRGRRY